LILLHLCIYLVSSKCAARCTTNLNCVDDQCTRCHPSGFCIDAQSCGGRCNITSDCSKFSNCKSCLETIQGFVCTAKCLVDPCTVDEDCQLAPCRKCMNNRCSSPGQCGDPCEFGNNDCITKECPRCGPNKKCTFGLECGGKCTVSSDCDPFSKCNTCIGGTCTVDCGLPCITRDQCNNPSCPLCVNGRCHSRGQCGDPCPLGNTDCIQKECGRCGATNKCEKGFKCGEKCTFSTECDRSSACSLCIAGSCTANCKQPCTADDDCRLLNCSLCIEGKCESTGMCNSPCQFGNTDCRAPECSRCNSITGKCIQGFPCGASCKVNTDCDQTSNCNACINSICTSSCGMPCLNNNECRDGFCSVCTNGRCRPKTE